MRWAEWWEWYCNSGHADLDHDFEWSCFVTHLSGLRGRIQPPVFRFNSFPTSQEILNFLSSPSVSTRFRSWWCRHVGPIIFVRSTSFQSFRWRSSEQFVGIRRGLQCTYSNGWIAESLQSENGLTCASIRLRPVTLFWMTSGFAKVGKGYVTSLGILSSLSKAYSVVELAFS